MSRPLSRRLSRRAGFSLIELMIVIAIIGILVAVALPQFASMTEDAKKTKAKSDTMEVAKTVAKFNSLEGKLCENLSELRGKYMSNIETLRDPWGKSYELEIVYGQVFSRGPDGKHNPVKDKTWDDDISADYVGALSLVDARIEIDPDPTTDDTTAYDRLYLYFNKGVSFAAPDLELGPSNSATQEKKTYAAFEDGDAAAGKVLRWFEGPRPVFRGSYSPFPEGTLGTLHETSDKRVLCIVFPPGFTEVFKTTTYLNLCGAKKSPNPFFRGLGAIGGAESSGSPCRIQSFEGQGIQINQLPAESSVAGADSPSREVVDLPLNTK